MLVLALLLAATGDACSARREFNITYIGVPIVVTPEQDFANIECRYGGDFTLFYFFKGDTEFFRYRPDSIPSTRTWDVEGIGSVEIEKCGPEQCILKLGQLTTNASGLYRCELERDVPPYRFTTASAHMDVYRKWPREPILQGIYEDYKDGETIQAYCRGEIDTELRWYINGRELQEFNNRSILKVVYNHTQFKSVSGMIYVQCSEYKYGRIFSSKVHAARFCAEGTPTTPTPQVTLHEKLKCQIETNKVVILCNNGSSIIIGYLSFLSLLLYLLGKAF